MSKEPVSAEQVTCKKISPQHMTTAGSIQYCKWQEKKRYFYRLFPMGVFGKMTSRKGGVFHMTVGPLADLSLEQRARCNFFLVLTKWATSHRQGLWDSGPLRFFGSIISGTIY
jgi:hypothetical protein